MRSSSSWSWRRGPSTGWSSRCSAQTESGGRTFGGPNQVVFSSGVQCSLEDSTMRASFSVKAGERVGFALQWAPPEVPAPEPVPGRAGRRADRGHDRGVALLGGRARHLPGPPPRARAPQLARAEGTHVPSDRRDRRRADLLAAGDGRRRAQLGLPLLLDPRREPDDRGAVHRRVLGRGGGVRVVHDQLGRRSCERALAADHVRDQRRARSLRARAAASARLA